MTFVQENAIDAASVPMTSPAYEVPGATRFAIQTESTGSPSYTVKLQGSINGTDWVDLVSASSSTPYGGYGLASVDDLLVRYIRADLQSLTGGTVSAHLMGV